MTLLEFKKNNKQKDISKLEKYKIEILELHNSNFSQKAIVEFLSKNNIKTSQQNVSKFLYKYRNLEIVKEVNNTTITKESKKDEKITPKKSDKKALFGDIDFTKKVGKDMEIKRVDWA